MPGNDPGNALKLENFSKIMIACNGIQYMASILNDTMLQTSFPDQVTECDAVLLGVVTDLKKSYQLLADTLNNMDAACSLDVSLLTIPSEILLLGNDDADTRFSIFMDDDEPTESEPVTPEQLDEIFGPGGVPIEEGRDKILFGLNILGKYVKNPAGRASEGKLYGPGVDHVIKAGLTVLDAQVLRRVGWSVEGEYFFCVI